MSGGEVSRVSEHSLTKQRIVLLIARPTNIYLNYALAVR
jgi:hypothetical protein